MIVLDLRSPRDNKNLLQGCMQVVEYLPNLRKVSVVYDDSKLTALGNSEYYLCMNEDSLFYSKEKSQAIMSSKVFESSIKFPFKVKLSKMSNPFILQSEEFYTIDSQAHPTLDTCSTHCIHCSTQITPTLTLSRLPSTYWQELVDCWSCHEQEFACNRFDLAPSKDRMLIGDTLWVHKMNVVDCCVERKCDDFYQLELDSVYLQDGDTKVFFDFEKNVAKEFLDLVDAHASYRFLIHQIGTKIPFLKVWLVNWQAVLFFSEKTVPIVKVLYSFDNFDEWNADNTVESLFWSKEKIERMKSALSTNVLGNISTNKVSDFIPSFLKR